MEKFSTLVAKDKGKDGIPGFLADVANYDVRIRSDTDTYTFMFVPKPYHGDRIKGGGAEVIVQKKDNQVIDVKYFK